MTFLLLSHTLPLSLSSPHLSYSLSLPSVSLCLSHRVTSSSCRCLCIHICWPRTLPYSWWHSLPWVQCRWHCIHHTAVPFHWRLYGGCQRACVSQEQKQSLVPSRVGTLPGCASESGNNFQQINSDECKRQTDEQTARPQGRNPHWYKRELTWKFFCQVVC